MTDEQEREQISAGKIAYEAYRCHSGGKSLLGGQRQKGLFG